MKRILSVNYLFRFIFFLLASSTEEKHFGDIFWIAVA